MHDVGFEQTLFRVVSREQANDVSFMCELYRSMCNMTWVPADCPAKKRSEYFWSCTWRTAGAIAAEIRNEKLGCNESYLDYYCGGEEGEVSERVRTFLAGAGWIPVPWSELEEEHVDR